MHLGLRPSRHKPIVARRTRGMGLPRQDGVLLVFRRKRRQNLITSQPSGAINTNHGIIVTIAVMSQATLAAKSEPDSRSASPIGVHALLPLPLLSTPIEISTATFSVSFASIVRKLSRKLVRFLILASVSSTVVVLSSLSVACPTTWPCFST